MEDVKIKLIPKEFKELIVEVEKGKIKIPTFQRSFVWSPKDIKLLLSSIYHKYPIGSFIFWVTNKQLDHHREICGRKLKKSDSSEIKYVIDGQQRITSLYAAIKYGKIEDNIHIYYFDIEKNDFDYKRVNFIYNLEETNEKNQEREKEIIEIEHKKLEEHNCIPLRKIFVEGPIYRKYVRTFPEEVQEKVDGLYTKFLEYPFSIIQLENEKDFKKIADIFDRINNTGKKLSVVSFMIAKAWAYKFDLRAKLNQLRKEISDFGEIREIIILQIAATILNNKKCKTNEIKDKLDIKELEENWENIKSSLMKSLDYLKQKFNIIKVNYLPFEAILVGLSYLNYNKTNLTKYDEQIKEWFWKACLSNRYDSAVEGKIEKDCEKFDLMLSNKSVDFNYEIAWQDMVSKIISQKYSLRNAFSITVLALFANQYPRDFDENATILNLSKTFSNLNKSNMHHIFPKAYFKKLKEKYREEGNIEKSKEIDTFIENEDSITNIMLIPFGLNKRIDHDQPSKYFKELSDIKEFEKALSSHLIKDLSSFGILEDNFVKFIEKRAELICKRFEVLTGRIDSISDELDDGPNKPLKKIEQELRKVINEKLSSKYGDKFWEEEQVIPQDIKKTVKDKIGEKLKRHPYEKIKFKKSSEKLEKCDIMDYPKIIFKNKLLFEDIFTSWDQFETHFKNLNYFRRPIAHNNEFNEVEKLNGQAALIWFKKILNVK